MDVEIPDRLVKAILFVRGAEDGRAWLQALPRRLAIYARRWDLNLLDIAEGGAMSCCVFSTTATGRETVLKIPFDAASGRLESRSLKRWSHTGASPAVLATAPASGVFLMTRVRPGTTATPSGAASDADQFCDLITRMTRPELGPLPGLTTIETVTRTRLDWARERFLNPDYEEQTGQLSGVEKLLSRLLRTTGATQVIHADLQSKNILVGPSGRWQAIDPFTCRGDLNAEAALWAVIQSDTSTITDRIAQLAQNPFLHENRLRAWSYVYAIAEYRSYLPVSAHRIRAFTADLDWQALATHLTR